MTLSSSGSRKQAAAEPPQYPNPLLCPLPSLIPTRVWQAAPTGEVDTSVQRVADIERRLKGQENFVTLSVEGQVHAQIMEAISKENLSQMYVGWASWL
jgi:hypothetical protein